jgi:basic amino acid/polyamine antiporter, APA family
MGLKRVLSFWDIFWIGVGGMVGVAILTFPSLTYSTAGPASIISWILAGIFSILMALIYVEMLTAFPKSGSLVVFPYEAFGKGRLARYLAFLEGIGYYLGTLFAIVVSALIIGNYISPWFSSGLGLIIAGEAAMLAVGIVNLYGVRMTSSANKMMSIFFTAFFAIIIAIGLWHKNFSSLLPFVSGTSGATGIITMVAITILAYGAWTTAIMVPEETKKIKGMAKAVIYSIIVVTVLYALLVLVTYTNLSAAQINNSSSSAYYYPILALVATFHNGILTLFFKVAAILAMLAAMLIMVLANARITYALAKLDFLPKATKKISKHDIPIYATLIAFIIPMALTLLGINYYYQYVVIGAIIGTAIPRIIDIAAYLKIRKKSSYKPTFKVKYGIWVAGAAFLGLVISSIGLGISDLLWFAVSMILITIAFFGIEKWRSG